MQKFTAEEVCIASIYPGTLDAVPLYHGPGMNPKSGRCTIYRLSPVPRGEKPYVLKVYDAFESVPNPVNSDGNRMMFDSKPVDVHQIVDFLVEHWAGNMIGVPAGARPGIMKIIGTVPQQKELDRMLEMQTAFAEYMFNEGELLARERDFKHITQTMRDSAVWLRRERNWINQVLSDKMEDCPACKGQMPVDAFICIHCGTKVRRLPEHLEALNSPAPAVVHAPTIPVPPTRSAPGQPAQG